GNLSGGSLERISPDEESDLRSNWGTSVSINIATPGLINSLTPKDFDIKISSFKTEKEYGIYGEEINFSILINNTGLNTSDISILKIFKDLNLDSIPQSSEQTGEILIPAIPDGDSILLDFQTSNFNIGINYFIAYAEMN